MKNTNPEKQSADGKIQSGNNMITHCAPDTKLMEIAVLNSDCARSLPRSEGDSPEAILSNSSSKSSDICAVNRSSGSSNEQNSRPSIGAANAKRLSEIAEMCPCIMTLASALGSDASEEYFKRNALASLCQIFKIDTISAEEAMFIHLARFSGLEAAFLDAFSPLLGLQRLLRTLASLPPV